MTGHMIVLSEVLLSNMEAAYFILACLCLCGGVVTLDIELLARKVKTTIMIWSFFTTIKDRNCFCQSCIYLMNTSKHALEHIIRHNCCNNFQTGFNIYMHNPKVEELEDVVDTLNHGLAIKDEEIEVMKEQIAKLERENHNNGHGMMN